MCSWQLIVTVRGSGSITGQCSRELRRDAESRRAGERLNRMRLVSAPLRKILALGGAHLGIVLLDTPTSALREAILSSTIVLMTAFDDTLAENVAINRRFP